MRKKVRPPFKLVESPTPFTEWVRNGAKEEEWQQFLRDKEEKQRREATKFREELERADIMNVFDPNLELHVITKARAHDATDEFQAR